MAERDWIGKYFAPLAASAGAAGLSDDTAQLGTWKRPVAVTTDAMVEGVHFLAADPIASIARKLVRVNVSDILSAGALPREALLTLGWPAERPEAELAAFAGAFSEELSRWNIALIGGDTVASPLGLFLSLTLTGECVGEALVRRGGAGAGDDLWVTGEIGGPRRGFLARAGGAGERSPRGAAGAGPAPGGGCGGDCAAGDGGDGRVRRTARGCGAAGGRVRAARGGPTGRRAVCGRRFRPGRGHRSGQLGR